MIETLKKMHIVGPFVRYIGNGLRFVKERQRIHDTFHNNKTSLNANSELKKTHSGKKCFILATGPSIKTQDLKILSHELCISVSNFFVHPDFAVIHPEFHVFAPSHKPISPEQLVAWFRDAEQHFPSGQKVLISATDRTIVEKNKLFKKQKIYFYLIGNKKANSWRKAIDLKFPLPSIATVPHLAMYLASYIGCSDIYLLGCDHNWSTLPGQNGHFYENSQHAMIQAGYSHKSVHTSMQARFKAYYDCWEEYSVIKEYTDAHQINVCNCTPDSLLDIFPRKTLSETVKK